MAISSVSIFSDFSDLDSDWSGDFGGDSGFLSAESELSVWSLGLSSLVVVLGSLSFATASFESPESVAEIDEYYTKKFH